eukprot:11744996-Ditylum_brightwellii.AAC.1
MQYLNIASSLEPMKCVQSSQCAIYFAQSTGPDIKQGIDGQLFWPHDDPRFTFHVIIGCTLTCGEEGVPYL